MALSTITASVNWLSDYGSGTITDGLLAQIFSYCRKHGIPTIVDSRYDIFRFKTVDYIKQNDAELAAAVGRQLETEEEPQGMQ